MLPPVMVTFEGRTMSLSAWGRERGIPYSRIQRRHAAGLPPEKVLAIDQAWDSRYAETATRITLDGETHTVPEWAELLGMSQGTIYDRFKRGLSPERILNRSTELWSAGKFARGTHPAWSRETVNETPWASDWFAQFQVFENPDGMSADAVGELMGITRKRVTQIEAIALEKLRAQPGAIEALQAAIELAATRKYTVEPEPTFWGDAHQVGRAKRDRRKIKEAA